MTSTSAEPGRPAPPLLYLSAPVREFLARESGSAIVLLVATVLALLWANLPGDSYQHFWATPVEISVGDWGQELDLAHLVNDLAMALFFLVVGLEISREVAAGELRDRRRLTVPALGALGGLIAPALIYLALQGGSPQTLHGWAIPISTDTAFLIGALALFGPKCPDQLRVFLLTLAIVDDIGAIGVMAVFYTDDLSLAALAVSAVLLAVLITFRLLGVWQLTPYLLVGLVLWFAVLQSGVHPTLAGVVVGLVIPARDSDPETRHRLGYYGRAVIESADARRVRLATAAARATVSPNERLQDALHPVSAYVVLPLFGLANAGVRLDPETLREAVTSRVTIGIVLGLVLGKTIGIALASGLALRMGLGDLPGRVRYGHLVGGATLAGIGFTIALFITGLAFDDEALRRQAQLGVLAGSLIAAVVGSLLLRFLGERLPLCTLEDQASPPPLPTGPWLDPSRT